MIFPLTRITSVATFILVAGLLLVGGADSVSATTYSQMTASLATNGTFTGLATSSNASALGLSTTTEVAPLRCYGYAAAYPSTSGGDILGCFNDSNLQLSSFNGTQFPPTNGTYWYMILNENTDKAIVYCMERFAGAYIYADCGFPSEFSETTFYDFLPVPNSVEPSNTVVVGASLYRVDDFTSIYYEQACVEIEQVDFGGSFLPRRYCFPAAYSGNGSFSTTTTITNGYWSAHYYLFDGDATTLDYAIRTHATTTYFTVGMTQNEYIDALGNYFGTTTAPTIADCTTDFELLNASSWGKFIMCMAIPTTSQLQYAFIIFKDQMMSLFPLGYISRISQIMQSETATSLPMAVITFPTYMTPNNQVFTVDLTPWNYFMGSSSIIGRATSTTGLTFRQATESYWEMLVGVCFGIVIVLRFFGLNRSKQ